MAVVKIANVKNGVIDLSSCSYVSEKRASEARASALLPGDVVVGMTGEVGDVAIVPREPRMVLNQRVGRIEVTAPDRCELRYLFFVLRTPSVRSVMKAVAAGSVQANLSPADFASLVVPMPPIDEQRRIVAVLGALDDKIDSNRRLAALLEEIAQAEFQRRFAGHLEGTEQLGDHVEVIRGRSYKSSELVESEKALVTLKSIRRGGGYSADGLKPYAGDFRPEQVVEPGELVVAHTDLTQKADVIGKPAVVPDRGGYSTLIASLDLAIVRPLGDALCVPFLYFLMLEPAFQQHAYGFANGSTVLHLNKQAIPTFPFEMPDRALLLVYQEFGEPIFAQRAALESEAKTLTSIRDTLLPKLIGGEIRVPDTSDPDEVIGPAAEAPGA